MKTTFKVMGAVFALGILISLGLHLFLQYGLTNAMREVVLPRIKAETGIAAKVGRLSINMPKGLLFLKGVEVRNPSGFLLENLVSVDRIEVAVDVASLFKRQPLRIKRLEAEDVLVNVIRNKDGRINLDELQESLPKPAKPSDERKPAPDRETSSTEPKPLPEILIEALGFQTRVRYVDFKLNQLDIALDLAVVGSGLSTLRNTAAPWGDVSIIGALGNDRTSFVTDLKLRLAPVAEPRSPSFDLTGKVLEIDPRLMEEVYDRMGIRSAPFGLEPVFQCRDGRFVDSSVALILRDIVLEDKLAKRIGGVGTIGTLRFSVPVEGSLQEPSVDVQKAMRNAIGDNSQILLDSVLKGIVAKEVGMQEPPEDLTDAAVEVVGEHVKEIGESEAAKNVLKDLADGKPAATNTPSPTASDVLVDILGEQVEEIGESEALKEDLKNLGRRLFGK